MVVCVLHVLLGRVWYSELRADADTVCHFAGCAGCTALGIGFNRATHLPFAPAAPDNSISRELQTARRSLARTGRFNGAFA
jgi:hypothetical protein